MIRLTAETRLVSALMAPTAAENCPAFFNLLGDVLKASYLLVKQVKMANLLRAVGSIQPVLVGSKDDVTGVSTTTPPRLGVDVALFSFFVATEAWLTEGLRPVRSFVALFTIYRDFILVHNQ